MVFSILKKFENVHLCRGVYCEQKGAMKWSGIFSSILVEQIKDKPLIKTIEVFKDFQKYYGMVISYHNVWYGKEMAKSQLHGDESLSYNQLSWYANSVMRTNPCSKCVLKCDPQSR